MFVGSGTPSWPPPSTPVPTEVSLSLLQICDKLLLDYQTLVVTISVGVTLIPWV